MRAMIARIASGTLRYCDDNTVDGNMTLRRELKEAKLEQQLKYLKLKGVLDRANLVVGTVISKCSGAGVAAYGLADWLDPAVVTHHVGHPMSVAAIGLAWIVGKPMIKFAAEICNALDRDPR